MMIIVDKRIGINYFVEVEIDVSNEIVEYWLSPFFSIQKENINKLEIIAKIISVRDIQEDYIYRNNIFYINSNMADDRLLYTLMSILRLIYKYMAFLMGYKNLHAAGLKYKDKGILIIAERNQGKTTMLINAIQDSEFILLANDQMMYSVMNDQLLGYPAAVGIRNNSCTSEKQMQIERKALWFVEDPFQSQPKPVIHIKDLSKIYRCNIAEDAKLDILVSYKKSINPDELVITNKGMETFSISEIELPFEKIYKEELLHSCKKSINYYMGKEFDDRISAEHRNEISIKQINVKCGINKMNEMLCKIKSILSKEG